MWKNILGYSKNDNIVFVSLFYLKNDPKNFDKNDGIFGYDIAT